MSLQTQRAPVAPPIRTLGEIERDDIVRATISEAVARLSKQHGNATYRAAWKVAIKILKGMQP
jgi:hypothetical protein